VVWWWPSLTPGLIPAQRACRSQQTVNPRWAQQLGFQGNSTAAALSGSAHQCACMHMHQLTPCVVSACGPKALWTKLYQIKIRTASGYCWICSAHAAGSACTYSKPPTMQAVGSECMHVWCVVFTVAAVWLFMPLLMLLPPGLLLLLLYSDPGCD